MKRILTKFILVLSFVLISYNSYSSDFIGTDITYTYLSNNTYEIKLTTSVVNLGTPLIRPFLTVNYSNNCSSGTIQLPRDTTYASSISCSLIDPHLIIEYKTQFTFPSSNCNDYSLNFNGPCCLPNYNNVQSPTPMDELATEITALSNQNTSATFNTSIIRFAQINSSTNIDLSVNDLDGDSISYQLTDASGNYPSGYTAIDPFGPNGTTVLNPSTGELTVNPTRNGKYLINVSATEFRNGIKVGKVQREWAIEVISNVTSNSNPSLSGINNTNLYTLNACIGDTIDFTAQITDLDTNQTIKATLLNPIFLSKIITTGRTVNFKWIIDSAFGVGTYTPTIQLNDSNCGVTNFSYTINVDSCITTSIQENKKESFTLYPNPTSGELFISIPKNLEISLITIRSFTGHIVDEIYPIHKTVDIDLSSHSPGIYFISVQSINSITTKKVILTK